MERLGLLLVLWLFCLSVCVGHTVLPLGDSITFGCGDPCIGHGYDCTVDPKLDCPSPFKPSCHAGYRAVLWSKLKAAGKNVTFVGPFLNGPDSIPMADRHHAGYPGAAIGPSQGNWDLLYYLSNWTSYNPDFILLMIGTNDLWAYRTGQQLTSDITNLLNKTFIALPHTHIFVSSVFNMPEVSTYPGALQYYNSALATLATQFTSAGRKLSFVDSNGILGMCKPWPNGDCCRAYDVHPSGPGYQKFAAVWYNAIVQYM